MKGIKERMSKNNMVTYKAATWDVMQHIFRKFNDHQLHCVIHFDTHIDESYLKKAVNISIGAFPILGCKFVEKSYFKFPYWEDCKFTSEDIVKIIEAETIEKTIEKLIVVKTRENFGPQIMINVIRSVKSDSLCIIMNHMLSDGVGFKEYLYMLSSIYSYLKSNPNYVLDMKMSSRGTNQIFKKFNILDKIKILTTSAKLSKYNSGVVFPLEGDNNNPFILVRKIPREKFILIKAYAKTNNATINDVLLTAYIRSLCKVLKINHLSLPCPVDLRRYLPNRKSEGICNLTSNMICEVGYEIGQTYEETLLKVKNSMDSEKDNFSCLKGPLMIEIIFSILPYKKAKQIISKSFNNPTIAMTNIGIIDKNKLIFDGLNIKDTFICGSIKYKPYFQIAVTTFDNEITLSINFCGTESDKIKITEFLSIFDNELTIGKL
ncbi:WS/DGAT domain-containing protein [Clostridium sp.]|uniref:WS/DGAT domain-containing protein n=1 Tax=Clostridium sp. TaxID=1506 RepID=UPI0028528A04|nr:WS/DGAT domain-containing protein [Clostridium sp.]